MCSDLSSAHAGEEGAKLVPETAVLVQQHAVSFDLMLPNAETSALNIPAAVRLCVISQFQPDGDWPHAFKQIHV